MTLKTQISSPYTRVRGSHKAFDYQPLKYTGWRKFSFDEALDISIIWRISRPDRISANIGIDFWNYLYQSKSTLFSNIIDGYIHDYYPPDKSEMLKITPSMRSILRKRIQELERLEAGWDSYSASPISNKAIESSISILTQISHKLGSRFVEDAFIAPCSDGSIQLEWELNSKELILKVVPNGKQIFYLFVSPSGEEREGIINSQVELESLIEETFQI